jgi:hypothetical protein
MQNMRKRTYIPENIYEACMNVRTDLHSENFVTIFWPLTCRESFNSSPNMIYKYYIGSNMTFLKLRAVPISTVL